MDVTNATLPTQIKVSPTRRREAPRGDHAPPRSLRPMIRALPVALLIMFLGFGVWASTGGINAGRLQSLLEDVVVTEATG